MQEIYNKIQQYGIVLMIVMSQKDKYKKSQIFSLDNQKHLICCFIVHRKEGNRYQLIDD